MWFSREIQLSSRPRGFHLITAELLDALPELSQLAVGLRHVHIKASLLGPSLTLPIRDGRPVLGTWQGVYLCEHRDQGGPRSLVLTLWGE